MYVCIILRHSGLSTTKSYMYRVGEGIAATDGVGRSANGTCHLQRPIWIRKNARKKVVRGQQQSPRFDRCWSPNRGRSPNQNLLISLNLKLKT